MPTIIDVATLVLQVLPTISQDVIATTRLLADAGDAVLAAQSAGGDVPPAEWAALEAHRARADAAFHAAAGA